MNPTEPSTYTAECPCGWSSKCRSELERASRLRYHRIQVHNDLSAVPGPTY